MNLMHLDCCKIIVEDVGSCKGWAGDKMPEFVFLFGTNQLDINPFVVNFSIVFPRTELFMSL